MDQDDGMKGRTLILFVIAALVTGLMAGLVFAALQAPEPTGVPAIVLESDAPPTGGIEPSDGGNHGGSPGPGGSTGPTQVETGKQPGGARPAPPPPPAPAGDDDEREDDGGDDRGDDGGDG
jgi:hypothetical protein